MVIYIQFISLLHLSVLGSTMISDSDIVVFVENLHYDIMKSIAYCVNFIIYIDR